jgi:hypothetical protein
MLAQVLVPASLTLGACWFGCFVIAVRAFLTQSLRQIGLLAFAFAGFWAIRHAQYAHCMAVLQAFLTHLLTVDLPKLMVLPKRLEINIPPAVTAVAEAAVGRDVVMRAVASAVLQADALENALIAALPLGPQSAAGGVSLPDSFQGELQVCSCLSVSLFEDALPCSKVTAFPLQSCMSINFSLGLIAGARPKSNLGLARGMHLLLYAITHFQHVSFSTGGCNLLSVLHTALMQALKFCLHNLLFVWLFTLPLYTVKPCIRPSSPASSFQAD